MPNKKVYNIREAVNFILEDLPSDDFSELSSSEWSGDDDDIDNIGSDYNVPEYNTNLERNADIDSVEADIDREGALNNGDVDGGETSEIGTGNTQDIDNGGTADTDGGSASDGDGKKRTERAVAYEWTKSLMTYKPSSFSSHQGPVLEHFGDCHTPSDYFLTFFDGDIRENILFQTNLYATQKQKGKTIPAIKEQELFGFLGINLLMGYHKLPSWMDYWKNDPDLACP